MSKKIKYRRICTYSNSTNKHHLLYQGRHWNSGYAKMLRDNFIFEIPICIHQNLHNHVLFDVPVPDGKELSKMLKDFEREKPEFCDIISGIKWLISHSEDERFCDAMKKQLDFFYNELYGQ